MSDIDKAFARFPGDDGVFFFIDIFTIETIGQSTAAEGAVIFCASGKYYNIFVPQEELDAAGVETAAEYAYGVLAQTATMAALGKPVELNFDAGDQDPEDVAEMVRQALEDPTVG